MQGNVIDYITVATFFIVAITAYATLKSSRFAGELVKAEFGPKLYINTVQQESDKWDKSILVDVFPGGEFVKGEGFCPNSRYIWILKIVNNGQAPATDVEIDYSILCYINDIKYDEERVYVEGYSPKLYKEVKRKINIDYIPPNGKYDKTIMYMSTFPYVELYAEKLKCHERSFITKRTKVIRYENPEFNRLIDSSHLHRLLGILK